MLLRKSRGDSGPFSLGYNYMSPEERLQQVSLWVLGLKPSCSESTDHRKDEPLTLSSVTSEACSLSQVPVQFVQKALPRKKQKTTSLPRAAPHPASTGQNAPNNKPMSHELELLRHTSGPGKGWAEHGRASHAIMYVVSLSSNDFNSFIAILLTHDTSHPCKCTLQYF